MLNKIQLLLASLTNQSNDYDTTIDTWQKIITLYRENETSANREALTILQPPPINKAQLNEKIENVKERVLKIVPKLATLDIKNSEWLELNNQFEKRGRKRLTSFVVLSALSLIKKLSYEELLASLKPESQVRSAKPVFATTFSNQRKRKREPSRDREGSNALILDSRTENATAFSETGVRLTELSLPATPERGFTDLRRTPGQHKVRPFFQHNDWLFYKQLTPLQQGKAKQGMVDTSKASHVRIRDGLGAIERVDPCDFRTTLPKIQARHGTKRRKVDVLKSSDIFRAEGVEIIHREHGSEYHNHHLVGKGLGGTESRENLVPGTAASNYNTYDIVEQPMASSLTEGKVQWVDMKVEPLYSGESYIPDQLVYSSTWQTHAGQKHHEQTYISTRSYDRVSGATLKTIDFARKLANSSGEESDNENLSVKP